MIPTQKFFMLLRVLLLILVLCLLVTPSYAQNVRDRIRPSTTTDSTRARYRFEGNTKGTAELTEDQATDVTLTLNQVSVRPIQTWVRTAGRIDKTMKVVTANIRPPEATYVKVGQRVRAFPPESKSSMFQAYVTKVTPRPDGIAVDVTLSGMGRENTTNYVMEIVTERGEFLSIPNEAIIEEGTKHVVYLQRQTGQYVPVEIETGIQGELYTAVVKGLKEGDQVVSFGSFFVDSEYKLKSIDQSPAAR